MSRHPLVAKYLSMQKDQVLRAAIEYGAGMEAAAARAMAKIAAPAARPSGKTK